MKDHKIIFTGFYGLFFLTLISFFSSLVLAHNYLHNIVLHLIGFTLFFISKVKDKKIYLKIIFLISLACISLLLISKTHDDFGYYHLPFTKYLTENKVIFGVGHLNYGFNFLSSLFFLNSVLYLPFLDFYSFHFSLVFFIIFFNFFVLKEIFNKKTEQLIKLLYIFAFVFFNLSFNRLSEFGTDKLGQVLIVIILIKLCFHTCFDKSKFKLVDILYLLPLFAFSIGLKTYFLPYILFGLLIFFLKENSLNLLKFIFTSKSFIISIIFLLINFIHHLIATGCFISPLSFTCSGENFFWSQGSDFYRKLSLFLEQWAKAGAGPNFRIDDPLHYIKGLNWLPNWIEKYFLVKVLDQLAIIFTIFVVIFLIFKNLEKKNLKQTININFIYFYSLVLVIFFIWFFNHPQLRYGGYSIVFLVLSIPIASIFCKFKNRKFFHKRMNYIIFLVVLILNIKNFDRIKNEFNRTDFYSFSNFPFFSIQEKKFISKKSNYDLKIYHTDGHCWDTPSPCIESLNREIKVYKKYGYYFLYK